MSRALKGLQQCFVPKNHITVPVTIAGSTQVGRIWTLIRVEASNKFSGTRQVLIGMTAPKSSLGVPFKIEPAVAPNSFTKIRRA
jgi:hypothetical protein